MHFSTAQSLAAIEALGAQNLSAEEIVRRLESEGVDSERARWLVRLHRRGRIAARLRTIGLTIGIVALAVNFALLYLAATDSPLAPPWIRVFPVQFVILGSLFMVLIPSVFAEAFPIDFIVTDNVPPVLEARPRAIRSHGHIDRLGRTMMTTMLMMGALMPGLEYPRIREWGALRKRGVETTGIVTAKEIVNSGKSRALVMRYRFGETEGSETVTRHEYDRLNAGDTIPVTYVPGNEWANAPVGRADLTWPVFLRRESGVVVAVLMLMGMALALRLAFRLISKHSGALARDGVAVVGEVTAANRHRLEYTYDTTGGRQTGRAVLGKKKARALPAPGDHIVVLYNAAAPEKSAALAMLTDAVFESLRPMAGFVA